MNVTNDMRRELAAKVRDVMGELATIELDGIPLADLIEPSEADEWVEEHGGLDEVRRHHDRCETWWHDKARMFELCADAGGVEALEGRLMPEGMEWPRFEDGEPVRIGDEFADEFGCIDVARPICFDENAYSLDSDAGTSSWVGYGERVRRPAVLAADGEPLEAGQTVWDGKGNGPYMVERVSGDDVFIEGRDIPYRGGDFTHQRPVLDADGVPIREGDTVYEVEGTGHAYKVVGIRVGDGDPLTPTVVTCDEGDGTSEHFMPDHLTHRAPVLAADGKPLEVGQTVWTTRDHDEFTVVDPSSTSPSSCRPRSWASGTAPRSG